MITVTISINGQVLYARSAIRKGPINKDGRPNNYVCDDGLLIVHKYDDGAVPLAIKMLKGIKEP